jgi:hypothetical protein
MLYRKILVNVEENHLPECVAVESGRSSSTFRKNVISPLSLFKIKPLKQQEEVSKMEAINTLKYQ